MTSGAIASFVSLQLGWLACVLGAAHGHAWLGLDADRPRALAIIAIVWAAVLPAFFALRTHLGTRVLFAKRPP